MEGFKFFVPVELEKAGDPNDPNRYKNMILQGRASTSQVDTDEQVLEPDGFNIDIFKSSGLINYEHGAKKTPKMLIGEPVNALVKNNEFFIKGKLWEKHPVARDLWDTLHIMKESGSTRKLGWSIEGVPLAKDPHNPNRITKALITHVALTFSPKNPGTFADICKGHFIEDKELDYDIPQDVDYLFKGIYGENEYILNKDFTITKSRRAEVGETRQWKGKSYKKQSNGKWLEVSESHGLTKKEHMKLEEWAIGATKSKKYKTESPTYIGVNKRIAEKLSDKEYTDGEMIKAMEAGSETGQQLVGKNTSGAALKSESLDDDLKILTIPISTIKWASDNWDSFKEDTKKALQKGVSNMIKK